MGELKILREEKTEILDVAQAHGLINVRVFGSVARGEDNPHSDIDFLVDLEEGRSLLDLVGGAVFKLQELLGRKVDIVTERGLHWYLRKKILEEARAL